MKLARGAEAGIDENIPKLSNGSFNKSSSTKKNLPINKKIKPPYNKMKQPIDFIIIGSGIAGLYAAYQIKRFAPRTRPSSF